MEIPWFQSLFYWKGGLNGFSLVTGSADPRVSILVLLEGGAKLKSLCLGSFYAQFQSLFYWKGGLNNVCNNVYL